MGDQKPHKEYKENQDLYQNAHERIKKKKNLATHAVVFLAGALVLIIINVVLGIGESFTPFNMPWFVWAIILWLFFLLFHAINVFLINRLMGKQWEERQMEKLVNKQLRKIEKMQRKVEKDHPLPDQDHNTPPSKSTQK